MDLRLYKYLILSLIVFGSGVNASSPSSPSRIPENGPMLNDQIVDEDMSDSNPNQSTRETPKDNLSQIRKNALENLHDEDSQNDDDRAITPELRKHAPAETQNKDLELKTMNVSSDEQNNSKNAPSQLDSRQQEMDLLPEEDDLKKEDTLQDPFVIDEDLEADFDFMTHRDNYQNKFAPSNDNETPDPLQNLDMLDQDELSTFNDMSQSDGVEQRKVLWAKDQRSNEDLPPFAPLRDDADEADRNDDEITLRSGQTPVAHRNGNQSQDVDQENEEFTRLPEDVQDDMRGKRSVSVNLPVALDARDNVIEESIDPTPQSGEANTPDTLNQNLISQGMESKDPDPTEEKQAEDLVVATSQSPLSTAQDDFQGTGDGFGETPKSTEGALTEEPNF